MSFVFISHASADKREWVRPLVEAIVHEGEEVWVDRPGPDGLGFTQSYIVKHNIGFLRSGSGWAGDIQSALRASGAVLGCLSRSLTRERDVLLNELGVASSLNKLVTCIVDDTEYSDLHALSEGLFDPGRLQSPRIDCALLSEAVDQLRVGGGSAEDLRPALYKQWEGVRALIESVNQIRTVPRTLRRSDVDRILPVLKGIGVGPIMKIHEVPTDLLFALGDHMADAPRALALLGQANEIMKVCEAGNPIADKMLVRISALPDPGTVGGQVFWGKVLAHCGLVARRTVGAVLLSPAAGWAFRRAGVDAVADEFVARLSSAKR